MEFREFQKYNASLYTGKQTQINIYNFNINTINQQITFLQESVSGILKQKRVFLLISKDFFINIDQFFYFTFIYVVI